MILVFSLQDNPVAPENLINCKLQRYLQHNLKGIIITNKLLILLNNKKIKIFMLIIMIWPLSLLIAPFAFLFFLKFRSSEYRKKTNNIFIWTITLSMVSVVFLKIIFVLVMLCIHPTGGDMRDFVHYLSMITMYCIIAAIIIIFILQAIVYVKYQNLLEKFNLNSMKYCIFTEMLCKKIKTP
jgi:hypothetical protein